MLVHPLLFLLGILMFLVVLGTVITLVTVSDRIRVFVVIEVIHLASVLLEFEVYYLSFKFK